MDCLVESKRKKNIPFSHDLGSAYVAINECIEHAYNYRQFKQIVFILANAV